MMGHIGRYGRSSGRLVPIFCRHVRLSGRGENEGESDERGGGGERMREGDSEGESGERE